MTRKTSIDTYNTVSNNGLLSKIRLQIYQTLYHHGAMSINETFKKIYPGDANGQKITSYGPRFAELKKIGVIEECGERPCNTTGHTVLVFQTTDNIGEALPRRISKRGTK